MMLINRAKKSLNLYKTWNWSVSVP